jgi:hypothetical protein
LHESRVVRVKIDIPNVHRAGWTFLSGASLTLLLDRFGFRGVVFNIGLSKEGMKIFENIEKKS